MDEDCTTNSLNQGAENLLAPPGFISRGSFKLRRVEQNANDDSSSIKTKKTERGTFSGTVDFEAMEAACRQRPWILFDQNKDDENFLEFESMEHDDVVNYVYFASIYFVLFNLFSF